MAAGKVWLVGAGPGDCELLTLKAARVIGQAEIIFIDDLVNPEILRHASPKAVIHPVGKRCGKPSATQDDINARIAGAALRGLTVVRLKGGDPLIFGRGHEELRYLAARGIDVEIVNGLTAGLAAATALGIPLTDRTASHGVSFVTAQIQDGAPESASATDWAALVQSRTTLVIYMGIHCVEAVQQRLLQAGMDTGQLVAVVQSASLNGERQAICTLGNLSVTVRQYGLKSPSIIIVGAVVALAVTAVEDKQEENGCRRHVA